jgi:hypothetical protein
MAKKRTLPPIMKAWGECRMSTGIKPGVKMSGRQYDDAKACVARKMRVGVAGKGPKVVSLPKSGKVTAKVAKK